MITRCTLRNLLVTTSGTETIKREKKLGFHEQTAGPPGNLTLEASTLQIL